MAEILTDADRALVLTTKAIQTRRRVAAALAAYRPVLDEALGGESAVAPSYVKSAVRALLDSFDRWEHDEHDAIIAAKSETV